MFQLLITISTLILIAQDPPSYTELCEFIGLETKSYILLVK